LIVLLLAIGGWVAWASGREGGVSGTVNSWIDDMRGEVAKVSSDPDFNRAVEYFDKQYESTGRYPRMTESDLASARIGVGINVEWCNASAIVVRGAAGGGTASRLLVAGRDLGNVSGRQSCPADLSHPTPWTYDD
jgi:hypothetical protein